MILNKKQTRALDYLEDNVTTEILYGGGAGGGKSILGCYWLLKMCKKYAGTRWVMGRNEMKTLKETTLVTFFKVCRMQGLKAGINYKYIDNPKNVIIFPNGSEILLKDLKFAPSDPDFDDLGSLEITGAFIDEANQVTIKAKTVLMSRIRHALDENGLIPKLLMSCNPAKNWVYKEFYRPNRDGNMEIYRKFIQALVSDNPDISKHYRDSLLKMDKASKERLLFGNWEYDDDPATLMDYDRILDCFSNTHLRVTGNKLHKVTCDVARFGADKTTIGKWTSPAHVRLFQYKHLDITQTAQKLKEAKDEGGLGASRIVVDEDGVGGGVVDIVKCVGFVNNSRPLPAPINPETDSKTGKPKPENYKNLKDQMYFRLAKRVNEGNLYIECDDPVMQQEIIEELEQVKRMDVDKDGKLCIVQKDKVKEILGRSPDYSDNLAMAELLEMKSEMKIRTL
jgi:phage terminase large subunit